MLCQKLPLLRAKLPLLRGVGKSLSHIFLAVVGVLVYGGRVEVDVVG